MSYQPPSQPGGDQPPSDQGQGGSSSGGDNSSQGNYTQPIGGQGGSGSEGGGYTPPPGGGYTPPPGGGYAPPPSGGGGYAPPPSGGGYGAPPPQGGYQQPPQGGYGAPPPQGGGYGAPPPQGGYPPQQGGYGAPPPPQGGYNPNMGALNTSVAVGSTTLNPGQLLQSYINAVTKPNPMTYEAEVGNASWVKVLVGIAVVAVVGFIFSLIGSVIATSSLNAQLDQLRANGQDQVANMLQGLTLYTGGSPFVSLIAPFITFFIGAGLQYLFAKMLGGQGNDFMVHSYLASLSYTPLRVVGQVLAIIPFVGACVTFLATLYQVYSVGVSMQVSQRMQSGRAQLAAWLPAVVVLVLLCVCSVAFAGLLASVVNSAGNR